MNERQSVEEIEEICNAFEEAWLSGQAPDVQSWLDRVDASIVPQLLPQLVRIDLEYRLKDGDLDVSLHDYFTRFGIAPSDISLFKSKHASTADERMLSTVELPLGTVQSSQRKEPKKTTGAQMQMPQMVGKFELISEVGRGGFGIVYKALDKVLKRVVALKIPRDPLPPESRTRFLREAEAAAVLDHPGLVSVFEAGELEDGTCYIATAFCDGLNLAKWMTKNQRFSWTDTAALVRDLAEAMQHAHNRGVMHRDLKPANVMVVQSENSTESGLPLVALRITDFGLAKIVSDRMEETHTSVILGTPNYMAPEQVDSQFECENPAATDIYGLGVILYEMLTGTRPFARATVVEVMDAIRHSKVRALRHYDPDVPADLETICLKCLARNPQSRYATCSELAQDLSNFIQGKPIAARRPSLVEKLTYWSKSPARLQETGLLSILLGIGVPVWIVVIIGFVSSEGLNAEIKSELVPQTLMVTILLLLPTAWTGYRILNKGIAWASTGFAMSVMNLLMVSPPLLGYTLVFPEMYARYPLGKIVAYTFLTAMFSIQVLQYGNALRVAKLRPGSSGNSHRPAAET